MPDVREDVVALGLDRTLEYGPDHVPALRRALEALLARLGLVGDRPLAGRVAPGDTVGVKPNLGYDRVVNLGAASELEELGSDRSRFAVGDYDQDSTAKSHMSSDRNEYLIPRTILAANVLINVPKLKTHKKSGITCALKNLVGICGHKSYLPHFREGRPRDGGDEFAIDHAVKVLQRATLDRLQTTPAALHRAVRSLGRIVLRLATWGERADLRRVMGGSWHGNDTLWRTILDLNKIARYADRD